MVTVRGRKSRGKQVIQGRHCCAENCTSEMWCKKSFVRWYFKVAQGPEEKVPLLFGSWFVASAGEVFSFQKWFEKCPPINFFPSRRRERSNSKCSTCELCCVRSGWALLHLHVVGPCVGQNMEKSPFHAVGWPKAWEERVSKARIVLGFVSCFFFVMLFQFVL